MATAFQAPDFVPAEIDLATAPLQLSPMGLSTFGRLGIALELVAESRVRRLTAPTDDMEQR